MKASSQFTVAVQLLMLVEINHDLVLTSEQCAVSTGANPVMIRQIFTRLKSAGLIRVASGHGITGLGRPAGEISLWDILSAVEGDSALGMFSFHPGISMECELGGEFEGILKPHLDKVVCLSRHELSATMLDMLCDEWRSARSKKLALNAHNKEEYPPMHTTEHILNRTMVDMFGCERSKNAHIERKKSKCDYHLADCPTAEQIEEIQRRVNEVIDSHVDVTVEFVDRSHIPDGVDLSKLPDDASETLRIVRVGQYDVCACIGAHVRNTSEIAPFKIISSEWKNGVWRVRFKLME